MPDDDAALTGNLMRKLNAIPAHWDANPEYQPEKCGLIIVARISVADLSYEFDEVIVWRDVLSAKLYWAKDSGCSCSTPFEAMQSLADLDPLPETRPYLDREVRHREYNKFKVRDIEVFFHELSEAERA